MMKSPTSLIRFRNAVGVVLALSAVFAVVISAVTFTQDRAIAEHEGEPHDVTVSISVADADVAEGQSVIITVTLSEAVAVGTADVVIPLKVGAAGDTAVVTTADEVNDYSLIETPQVIFAPNAMTGTYSIRLENDQVAESLETLTVSLGVLPTGYAKDEDTSVTLNIADVNNAGDPQGDVQIKLGEDDLGGSDRVEVGDTLTADTSGIADADNPDNAETTDVVDPTPPLTFTYQWQRVGVGGNEDEDIDGAESSTYEVDIDDLGRMLKVVVTSSDQYGNGDGEAEDLTEQPTQTADVVYNDDRPYIVVADVDDNDRLNPGDTLTIDSSGLFANNQLIDDEDMVVNDSLDDPVTEQEVTITWKKDGEDFACDTDGDGDGDVDDGTSCRVTSTLTAAQTYTLLDGDETSKFTLVATYQNPVLDDQDPPRQEQDEDNALVFTTETIGTSEEVGPVMSRNAPSGAPSISGTAQVGAELTASTDNVADADATMAGYPKISKYQWIAVDKAGNEKNVGGDSATYTLSPEDVDHTIKVEVTVDDGTGDTGTVTSLATSTIAGSPGQISKIEPGIRGITVSGGDTVTLEVLIYGLQNSQDPTLGNGVTFAWNVSPDRGSITHTDAAKQYEANLKAPDSPGTYTVTASLGGGDCQPDPGDRTDDVAREEDCSAEFDVTVRRPSADGPEQDDPTNPPGVIPGILADSDGNQYEVFTPVEGGTFTGEGYSLNVAPGAVPNGEFLGIRMSDEGAASNLGMTHQRYTLGGNMYAISAVDSSQAAISSYVLDDPAMACVPLPDELRSNISDLALVAINSDGSLTILAAQVRIRSAGNIVCGALSNLPASVAVGSSGAPAAIPTPTPEPTAVPPPTGGTAPASSMVVLWSMLLGVAVFALGSVLVIARRREGARTR